MSNHSSSIRYELTYYHTSNCSGSLDGYFVSPSRHGQFCRTLLGVQDLNLRTLDYASSKIDHFSNSHRLLHYLSCNSLFQLPSDCSICISHHGFGRATATLRKVPQSHDHNTSNCEIRILHLLGLFPQTELYLYQESNLDLMIRSHTFYPLNYRGK